LIISFKKKVEEDISGGYKNGIFTYSVKGAAKTLGPVIYMRLFILLPYGGGLFLGENDLRRREVPTCSWN
jgi:hypothetical protein